MLIFVNAIIINAIACKKSGIILVFFVILGYKILLMKKIFLIAFIILFSVQCFSETIDSLKTKREALYQKYSEINIPGKELSEKDFDKVIDLLKDLVIVDTRIIKEYSDSDNKLKESATTINNLESTIALQEKDKERTNDLLFIIYIAGGVIVVFLIISIIMLLIYMSRYSKTRKKQNIYTDMLKEADNDRLKMLKMEELLTQKQKEINDLGIQLQNYNAEKTITEDILRKLEDSVTELQKTPPVAASEYNEELEKVNINLSKMEKLMRMKELGIVTDEEFNTFKQKFLGEM